MVGLGGLEPPTSPLSGARSSHLSYRPVKTAWRIAHSLFSLRRLSMIRNCVQIRALCTRRQFLYHFSLLSVLKVRVVSKKGNKFPSIAPCTSSRRSLPDRLLTITHIQSMRNLSKVSSAHFPPDADYCTVSVSCCVCDRVAPPTGWVAVMVTASV